MNTTNLSSTFNQSSVFAAILYSIVATAGLFYVNLGGAFLSAFVDGLGVERDVAGFIVSANKYGAAFGALIATFIVKKVQWRKVIRILFIGKVKSIDDRGYTFWAENRQRLRMSSCYPPHHC